MNDLLSVIIPVYKVEAYLRQCLDSVVTQTYSELQIILVDDGSPDGSGAICDEYAAKDSRIQVIHQPNAGVSAARNAGMDMATGEYLTFIDSDDYIDPDMYEALLKVAHETGADVVECNYRRAEGVKNGTGEWYVHSGMEAVEKMLTEGGYPKGFTVSPCVKLIRSACAGKLRFLEHCSMAEDMLFCVELFCQAQTAVKVNRRFYTYRITEGSATDSAYNSRKADEVEAAKLAMDVLARTGQTRLRRIGAERFVDLLLRHWTLCRNAGFDRKAKELRRCFLEEYPRIRGELPRKHRLKCELFRFMPEGYRKLLAGNMK